MNKNKLFTSEEWYLLFASILIVSIVVLATLGEIPLSNESVCYKSCYRRHGVIEVDLETSVPEHKYKYDLSRFNKFNKCYTGCIELVEQQGALND
jgi:hypothetical protein